MEEMVKQSKGMAIASMVLGIVGLVLSCLVIGIIPCVIGLILGIVVLVKQKAGQGMAIAGIVTSLIGIAFLIMALIGFGSFMSQYGTEIMNQQIGAAGPAWETVAELGADSQAASGRFDGGTAGMTGTA